MPENETRVLCHGISSTNAAECNSAILGRSHSINMPILKYIQEIEHLHQNLIKYRTPAKAFQVPVRCRLVIVPKARQTKQMLQNDIPYDSIMISKPLVDNSKRPCGETDALPSATEAITATATTLTKEKERNVDDPQKSAVEVAGPIKPTEAEQKTAKKHIHPCICDLTNAQRDRINSHLRARAEEQLKFQARIQQIEEELRLIRQQAEQREEECLLQQELWGDQADCGTTRRKRMFARRVSGVVLGLRRVINWKKPPLIIVKYNKVFEMRKANTKYCKDTISPILEDPKEVVTNEEVDFPVTKTSELRKQHIDRWINEFNKEQEAKGKYPNRPEFVINRSKLWSRD